MPCLLITAESSRKTYIKNKRKLDMLAEGALNFNTNCKVRRVDCMTSVKDEVYSWVETLLEMQPFLSRPKIFLKALRLFYDNLNWSLNVIQRICSVLMTKSNWVDYDIIAGWNILWVFVIHLSAVHFHCVSPTHE